MVTVVDRERYGLGWAHKEGLRRTQGDLIAFTDDCLPPPEWLASLVGGARPLCPGRRWKRAESTRCSRQRDGGGASPTQ